MGIGRGLEILDTCAFQANPLLLSHPLLVSTSPPPRTSLGAGVPSAGVPGAVDTMGGMDGAATDSTLQILTMGIGRLCEKDFYRKDGVC